MKCPSISKLLREVKQKDRVGQILQTTFKQADNQNWIIQNLESHLFGRLTVV